MTGGISAPLFLWGALSSGAPRIAAMGLAVLCVYVAAYRIWSREHDAREAAEAELRARVGAKADIRGITRIQLSMRNFGKQRTRLYYWCECSNFGEKACEISSFELWISQPDSPRFAALQQVEAQVVEPERLFRLDGYLEVPGVTAEQFRMAKLEMVLLDSLKNHYVIETVLSPRLLIED